jgi:hypothetical protein
VTLLVLDAPPAHAAKTDVVVLKNGDRITGEVQQVDRGRLELKTDDLSTVQIEWDKVASVSADATFDIEDLPGNRYVGSLKAGDRAGQVGIVSGDGVHFLEMTAVARMRRIDHGFWNRLEGSLDLGAGYTSATSLFTLDLAATLGFERPGFEVHADASSTLTSQEGLEDTRRNTLSLVYERRFEGQWVAVAQAALEQNRELGFELRSSATAGGGRYLVRQRRDSLMAVAGLSVNRERPTEGESTTNLEAMAAVLYDRFAYDTPKVDVTLSVAGFASLTEAGRYRLEVEGKVKREIVKDFYATLRGYESYDSRPPTQDAVTSDYGLTFALGFSF